MSGANVGHRRTFRPADGFHEQGLLASFAVYDVEGANASVRMSLPAAAEVCRGQMMQLGISMLVPEASIASFNQARRDGVLMKQTRSRAISTSIRLTSGSPSRK